MNNTIRQGLMGKTAMHRSVRRQIKVGFVATFALLAQSAVALCCGSFAHAGSAPANTHPADCPSLMGTAAAGEAVADEALGELPVGEQCLHPAAALCAAHALPPVSSLLAASVHFAADAGVDHLLIAHDTAVTAWSSAHGVGKSRAETAARADGTTLFLTTGRLRL